MTEENKKMLEYLLSTSEIARNVNPVLQSKIKFRVGSNGVGTWEHPETHCEHLFRYNCSSAAETGFRRSRAMMPFQYMDKTGKDFDWNIYGVDSEESKKVVNAFLIKFPEVSEHGFGLYIYSKTKGSGKTMLSCCIINELAKRYVAYSYKFCSVPDLIELTKDFHNQEAQKAVRELYSCSVLVLDDIGAQMSKEWTNSVLYRLINTRMNDKRVTIYTSNMEMDKLNLDERIIDRISAGTYKVSLPEVSIRQKEAWERKREVLYGR